MHGLRLPIESSAGLTRQLERAMLRLRHQLEPLHWVLQTDLRSVALDGASFLDCEERYDEIMQAMARDAAFDASCIDAARWEMSSPNGDWLVPLRREFPAAQEIPHVHEAV